MAGPSRLGHPSNTNESNNQSTPGGATVFQCPLSFSNNSIYLLKWAIVASMLGMANSASISGTVLPVFAANHATP